MGKLIKNHWARLIVLTAAACKSPKPKSHKNTLPNHPNNKLTKTPQTK